MVFVLALLNVLSFIDRNALNVLIDDVKLDFTLSDTQASLLLGAAFVLLYAFASLPAGYLIDRFSRRLLVLWAVTFWSAMTILSGLASSFGMLFAGRMGVGLGESVLTPAAGSLIRNTMPLRYRARAFGMMTVASSVGGGVALVVVGGLMGLVPAGAVELPVLGVMRSWQVVLLIIGVLGLPLALLVLSFPEPSRAADAQPGQAATIAFYLRWIRQHRGFYLALFAAQALTGIGTHGLSAWLPIALSRAWGVSAGSVGVSYGSVQITGALIGLAIGTATLDYLLKRKSAGVALLVSAVCISTAMVASVLVPLMPTPTSAWAMLLLHWMTVPTSGVAAMTALSAATPNAAMGKMLATSWLCLSLAGYGLGPTLVALVGEHVFEGPMQIGYGISIVAAGALTTAAIGYAIASRYLDRMQRTSEVG